MPGVAPGLGPIGLSEVPLPVSVPSKEPAELTNPVG